MILQYLSIFMLSIITSFLLVIGFKKLFYKYEILDNPKKYWKNRKPIPYAMWVVFFISFFFLSLIFIDYSYKLWLIWVFGFLITGISFIDDRLNVSAKVRLIFQILIWAVIWITSIKIWYISNIFWWIASLETHSFEVFNYTVYYIPIFFTILWYVFVFNALNWTDGIQWNTSWLSIISFFILFLLWVILFNRDNYEWWVKNAEFIMWISIILVWIIIPFWWYDIREKILMWDSGTMFLWFMLATLAIIAWWKVATVLVVFWIYSVDAIYVIIKRVLKKKNPLNWDFSHLHHRLQKIWMSNNQVLTLVYSLSFIFWITALFLEKNGKIIVFLIIVVVVVFLNKIAEIVKKKKFK